MPIVYCQLFWGKLLTDRLLVSIEREVGPNAGDVRAVHLGFPQTN